MERWIPSLILLVLLIGAVFFMSEERVMEASLRGFGMAVLMKLAYGNEF